MSLREFVENRVTTEIDNGQTRVMAGVANVPPILYPLDRSEAEVPFVACGRELLAQATNNLDGWLSLDSSNRSRSPWR